ncbi:LOW QUALITY PROTEIN: hypothetical protein MSG28_003780 [Choristoneura fumiferana]|uniref:Uncharacterized protein n=1 Tax=Choristoneura fumiferana TaxID=7141 RepID=A0ACC0KG67_CHOFU|nr:LOW QUALITY PROTEIN: hypothetical protein MSG28_003780 [Choristoneura fumiferana]
MDLLRSNIESETEFRVYVAALNACRPQISQPAALVSFVRHLHALVRRELGPGALIWYDSVTADGALHWQNTLTEHNRTPRHEQRALTGAARAGARRAALVRQRHGRRRAALAEHAHRTQPVSTPRHEQRALTGRRELGPGALLWYDSVTADGALHWQNTLTEHNRVFFEASDGLFTNYAWSAADVARGAAAAAAGPAARRRDLLVGLDVWGRNFIGGGQFNTQHAVKIAHRHECSLAVFAPAWTYEAAPDGPGAIAFMTKRMKNNDFESLSSFDNISLICHGEIPLAKATSLWAVWAPRGRER